MAKNLTRHKRTHTGKMRALRGNPFEHHYCHRENVSWKTNLLTKTFRSFVTPAAITQTPACFWPMQFKLRETRVTYHTALWVIIAFLGRRVSKAIFRVTWIWTANTVINWNEKKDFFTSNAPLNRIECVGVVPLYNKTQSKLQEVISFVSYYNFFLRFSLWITML